MGKKKKPKPSQPAHSKLIVPGAETGRKSQLLVPGGEVGKSSTRLSIPDAEPAAEPVHPAPVEDDAQAAVPADQFTVINEDTGESLNEESHPVKITAMVPPTDPEASVEGASAPPVEEGIVEPVSPVEMVAPAEAEGPAAVAAEEYTAAEQPAPAEQVYQEYEAPAEGYVDPAAAPAAPEEAYVEGAQQWEQPAQEAYYDPNQYAPPPPVPAPAPAPPPPMPQAPPAYGYGPPPVYHTQPMAPGPMYPNTFAPPRNVPSWALVLVGALVGFLGAMVIFKFTGMGAALRGDLIEEGRQKAAKKYDAQIKQLKDDGYDVGDEEGQPEPDSADDSSPDDSSQDGGGGDASDPVDADADADAADSDLDPGDEPDTEE